MNGAHSGSFVVPTGTPIGNYRMRVTLKYSITEIYSCEFDNSNYGETEDYILTVLDNPVGNCDSYTIWNGSTWSNGIPNATARAIIQGNLTVATDLTACELLLNSGVVNVLPGMNLTVYGEINNTKSAANFIVQSGANLIQIENVFNYGNITVKRDAWIKHLDYTIWSSPVMNQGLQAFSPYTLPHRILKYDGSPVVNDWVIATGNFGFGKGYMFRAPNVFDDGYYPNAYTWTGTFMGVPFNGSGINYYDSIGTFQSIGNPYPSNLDRQAFHDNNPNIGSLYFWTNTFSTNSNEYDSGNNWKVVNTNGESVSVTNQSYEPVNYIAVGQGFVAKTQNNESGALFMNYMRTNQSGVFSRQASSESHKYWLNLSNQNSTLNQILVSYNTSSTNELDFGIDSELYNYTGSALYSLIENNQDKFAIQGRSLPFEQSDIVPLGFRATQAGNYTVSLSNFEGVFAEGQEIYLRDKFTQVEHNLKLEAYSFISEQGTFNERFEVIYTTQSLNVENPYLENSWIVYKDDNSFNILTQGFEIKDVVVYDMLGRVVYKANEVYANSHNFSNSSTNQVLIVKIITENQQELVKKVIR